MAILTALGAMLPPYCRQIPSHRVLLHVAIDYSRLGLSHINDAGFWIVTKYLGLSVKDGLRTWTVLSTILSFTGFILTACVFMLVR